MRIHALEEIARLQRESDEIYETKVEAGKSHKYANQLTNFSETCGGAGVTAGSVRSDRRAAYAAGSRSQRSM